MAETETPLKLLLVDDDQALRGVMATHLQRSGYETFLAANGSEALEIARENQPDLVVSDIMMPVMDGVELLRRIRAAETLRDAFVILLTAKDRTTDVLEGFAATADDYVTKPFKMAELLARIAAGARLKRVQNELRETNRRLREALRDRAQLLGVAAHDMRNPVSVISIYTSLIGQDVVPLDTIKEVCQRRAVGLSRLIDNLLDITKIDAGMVDIVPEAMNVSLLVVETCALFEPVAKQKRVAVERDCIEDLTLFADRVRLSESLNTLFENLIRLAPEESAIRATLRRGEDEAVFSLSGRGGAFRPDAAEALFRAPRREEEIPDGYDAGMLLGFAIVRKLVEMMGGSVFAESDGTGVVFGLRLPAAADDRLDRARARYAETLARREGEE